jgi:iturin family lipopeptide synthetase B
MIYKVDERLQGSSVPIGRAAQNTTIHLLSPELEPVPPGEIGEIYVERIGLAREYLYEPELTAERFISSPYNSRARMYRTGDLARQMRDGNIEYCGRMDDQIKIMGYRVEIAEIEHALESTKEIKQAVVLQDNQDVDCLHACIVTQSGSLPPGIQKKMAGLLPAYMLPRFYWVIREIPLTTNGKVEKERLLTFIVDSRRATPLSEQSEMLVETIRKVWASVLENDSVKITDNFFDAGGTSIKAVQVVINLKQEYDVELSVPHIFLYPTIKSLVEFLLNGQIDIFGGKVNVSAAKTVLGKIDRIRNRGTER